MSAPLRGKGPPKILVVDDDLALLRMVETVLAKIGEVTRATDGLEALERIQAGYVPDLIVTDLMMPRVDGLKFCQQVKAIPATANVPVIMLTAKGTPKDVIAGINVGARHYVTKPFKMEELVDKVNKALRLR